MKIIICIPLFLIAQFLFAQNEGDKWVIGYYSNGSPEFSIMHLDFRGNQLNIEYHFDEMMQMSETSSNICDSRGEAILWTNGMQLFGKHGQVIADTIAFDGVFNGYWDWFYTFEHGPLGFPEHDGAIILPVPNKTNEYSVLYHSASPHPTLIFQIDKILEARVRMKSDTTFELVYKDSLIGPVHKWYTGPILSTKHANGRDWWIVLFESDSARYYAYLLSQNGVAFSHSNNVDTLVNGGYGQAVFSSNGNYIARMDAIDFDEGQYITIYSFDRCSGVLTRLETINTTAGFQTGLAFSKSEQYLYADDNTNLWQWDLLSDNIISSMTLVDTFDGFIQPGWFQMRFGPMKLAPDGRIYVVPSAGSSEYVHVIERPDLPSDQCQFRQHSINLTKPNGRSAPNLPNFRLGPIDGSECDSLGINNIPVSKWRFEKEDVTNEQIIRFTDLSYFEPDYWYWDFGDGNTSDAENPLHTFEAGIYNVCLTVSNSYGVDSFCQQIEIFITNTKEVQDQNGTLSIYPNPFEEYFEIKSEDNNFSNGTIDLFDPLGKVILSDFNIFLPAKIFLPQLPVGTYFLRLNTENKLNCFKLIKI